jgi:hypothetical protein
MKQVLLCGSWKQAAHKLLGFCKHCTVPCSATIQARQAAALLSMRAVAGTAQQAAALLISSSRIVLNCCRILNASSPSKDYVFAMVQGTAWNAADMSEGGAAAIVTPRFQVDGSGSSFTQAELKAILTIWRGGGRLPYS